jgi:heptaprenyl diphosphate synthase
MPKPTPLPSERRETLAFFGALCLLLSTLEYLIPKPIPFMRVGLANLPVLLALSTFDARTVLLLVTLKVLGQGFIGGTLFSYVFVFSAAGSFAAGLAMLAASRLGGARISLVGVSVFGALASNVAQLLLAVALVFGRTGWLIGPPFLAVGTVSGLLLGMLASAFERTSTWLRRSRGLASSGTPAAAVGRPPDVVHSPAPGRPRWRRARRDLLGRIVSPRGAFLAGLAMLLPFVFIEHLGLQAALVALYLALSLLVGRRFRPLFPVMATIGIVAANLLMPSGRVLWSAGPLSITSGALMLGLRKSLTFVGLVYLSLFAIRPGLPLPGKIGGLAARMVYYFERLLEADKSLDRRDPLGSLDRLLWRVAPHPAGGSTETAASAKPVPRRTTTPGWVLLSLPVLLTLGALFVDVLAL